MKVLNDIESELNVPIGVYVNSASDFSVQMCKLICIFDSCISLEEPRLNKATETLEVTQIVEIT